MNYKPNYNRYGPGRPFVEEPEIGCICPICGKNIAWWEEPHIINGHGDLCHEKCWMKRLEDAEWETV